MVVELVKEHPHNGRKHFPPTELALPTHLAQWLISRGVAKDAGKAPTKESRAAAMPVRRASCCGHW
jgi:hypothetical protein